MGHSDVPSVVDGVSLKLTDGAFQDPAGYPGPARRRFPLCHCIGVFSDAAASIFFNSQSESTA